VVDEDGLGQSVSWWSSGLPLGGRPAGTTKHKWTHKKEFLADNHLPPHFAGKRLEESGGNLEREKELLYTFRVFVSVYLRYALA
jgi:hypothetical protein